MFSKIFGINKETNYFIGSHFEFSDNENLHKILSKTRVDKFTAEQLEAAMKFEYKNGVLSKVYSIEEGTYSDEELRFAGELIKYRDYPLCSHYAFVEDKNGSHQIGGIAPHDFIFPENNTTTPFVYLGFLSNSDPVLNWLPFEKLNLICPIYSKMGVIYLDYTKPNHPKLLNKITDKLIGSEYDGLTSSNILEFESAKTSFARYTLELFYNDEILGVTGALDSTHKDFNPTCPISGKEMKFLIQLNSSTNVKIKYSDIRLDDQRLLRYFEKLDFWGSGQLNIFIEPTTKVIAYFIQNT